MKQIEVTIDPPKNVLWQPAASCNFNLDSEIDVWRVHIPSNKGKVAQFSLLLRPDEIARANRYMQESDRDRFIISRAALRQILSGYINQPATAINFISGTNKKPFIEGANVKYNVSHSADWVLIALAKTDVGVDTETINASFDFKSILADNFNHAEIDFINNNPANFFLLWTRKEALLKATGQGLDENLKHIPSLDGEHITHANLLITDKNWRAKSLKMDNESWGTIACQKLDTNFSFFELS